MITQDYKELYVKSQKQVSALIEMPKKSLKQTDDLIKIVFKLEQKLEQEI